MKVDLAFSSNVMNLPQAGSTLIELPKFKENEISENDKFYFLEHYLNFIKENNDNLTWSTFGGFPGNLSIFKKKIRDFIQEYNLLSMKFSDKIELSIIKNNTPWNLSYKLRICSMEEDYALILKELNIDYEDLHEVLNIFVQTNVYNEYLGCCVWSS